MAGTSHREPPRDGPLCDTLLTLVGRARLNEGDTGEGDASSARNTSCPRRTAPFMECGWRKPIGTGGGFESEKTGGFGSESVAEFIGIRTSPDSGQKAEPSGTLTEDS